MRFLAISGSCRQASTNTAMLQAVASIAQSRHQVTVFDRTGDLPVFSPDLELVQLPDSVRRFASLVGRSDGLIISSPEYIRSIPGGLKNSIDWLVSRDEIVDKPIVLMHASHRGDDMLAQLRLVLSTASARFAENLFLRFELVSKSPEEVTIHLEQPRLRRAVVGFLDSFSAYCDPRKSEAAPVET